MIPDLLWLMGISARQILTLNFHPWQLVVTLLLLGLPLYIAMPVVITIA
jgi:hypothetical protein